MRKNGLMAMAVVAGSVIVALSASAERSSTPEWEPVGRVEVYEIGLTESAAYEGEVAGLVASRVAADGDFGGLSQDVSVKGRAGETVEVAGRVRTENVERWAGLFARIDDARGQPVGMADAQAAANQDWSEHRLSLAIPEDGETLHFGVLVQGRGAAMADALSVSVGGEAPLAGARDLGFESGGLASTSHPENPLRETIQRMRTAGSTLQAWRDAHAGDSDVSGVAPGDHVDWSRCEPVSAEVAVARLGADADSLPGRDGWGRPLEYCAASEGEEILGLRSAGADGAFEATEYEPGAFPLEEGDRDIVWLDGYFVTWPVR